MRHSLFPSVTYYEQSYTVERLTTDVSKYEQLSVYDARQQIDRWRAEGWGWMVGTQGVAAGNAWGEQDPRIISGVDVPEVLAPGIPKE